jgi:hypothetical protein
MQPLRRMNLKSLMVAACDDLPTAHLSRTYWSHCHLALRRYDYRIVTCSRSTATSYASWRPLGAFAGICRYRLYRDGPYRHAIRTIVGLCLLSFSLELLQNIVAGRGPARADALYSTQGAAAGAGAASLVGWLSPSGSAPELVMPARSLGSIADNESQLRFLVTNVDLEGGWTVWRAASLDRCCLTAGHSNSGTLRLTRKQISDFARIF